MNQIRTSVWIVLCLDADAVALAETELLKLGEHTAVLVKRAWSKQNDNWLRPHPRPAQSQQESNAHLPTAEHAAVIALRARRPELRNHVPAAGER